MKEKNYTMYVLSDKRGTMIMHTLSFTKKDSILSYFRTMEEYRKCRRKYGWECKKVNVTVKPIPKKL